MSRRKKLTGFIKLLKESPCLACGKSVPVDLHHVRTRGANGPDEYWNMLPLCRADHTRWHYGGPSKFFQKYPHVLTYLLDLGWCVVDGKLRYYVPDRKEDPKPDS